jgi:hypothetical protein
MGNSISNSNPVRQVLEFKSRALRTPGSRSTPACPPGYIILHNLCNHCSTISESLIASTETKNYARIYGDRQFTTWVLKHIKMQPTGSIQLSNDCHLCTLIINVINKGKPNDVKPNPTGSNMKVILQETEYYIGVSVADSSDPIGYIFLRKFKRMTSI